MYRIDWDLLRRFGSTLIRADVGSGLHGERALRVVGLSPKP